MTPSKTVNPERKVIGNPGRRVGGIRIGGGQPLFLHVLFHPEGGADQM